MNRNKMCRYIYWRFKLGSVRGSYVSADVCACSWPKWSFIWFVFVFGGFFLFLFRIWFSVLCLEERMRGCRIYDYYGISVWQKEAQYTHTSAAAAINRVALIALCSSYVFDLWHNTFECMPTIVESVQAIAHTNVFMGMKRTSKSLVCIFSATRYIRVITLPISCRRERRTRRGNAFEFNRS